MAANLPGPKFIQLFDPVIWALKTLGGSARPAEVRDQVAQTWTSPTRSALFC